MNSKAGTRLGAFLLPLVLVVFTQGGGCGGGSGGRATTNARGANASANANASGTGAANGAEARSTPAVSDNRSGPSGAQSDVLKGEWGTRGARLNVSDDGAEIEFDCAHGRMGRLTTDAEGNFDVRGVFVLERGGPVRADEQEDARPARYTGRVEGKRMTLKVVITDQGEDAEQIQHTLTHGATARLTKCL